MSSGGEPAFREHPHPCGAGGRPRVVVGVDGSLSSLQALRAAVAEARRRHAVLHVVRAWYPPKVTGLTALMAYTPAPWLKQARDSVATAFEEALGGVPADLEVRVRLIEGDAGVELVRVADGPEDLLVVGAGRPGLWHRLTHGTVSGYCVARAACPVLVVPLPPLARQARRPRILGRVPDHVPADLLQDVRTPSEAADPLDGLRRDGAGSDAPGTQDSRRGGHGATPA